MAISTFCLGCRSLLRLPDELAGKQVRCQKCNQLFMVPGLLGGGPPKSAAPSVKPPPRPEPMPIAPPVAQTRPPIPVAPLAPPLPRTEAPLPSDGVPAVVLVEVPTRPTPPPMPEQSAEARPSRSEPSASARREIPPMNLSARGQPRRTNRPRHPSSVMAGLTLTVMGLLFVGLLGVSGATWMVTSFSRQPINNGQFVQQQPQQPQQFFPPKGGGPMVGQPPFVPNGGGGLAGAPVINPGPPGPRFDDKLATKIALTKGVFHTRAVLTNNDPLDRLQRPPAFVQLPCKVFLVELEANKTYVVDYKRVPPMNMNPVVLDQAFDPFLRIESQDGQRLVEHDDIIPMQELDSRIEFKPAKTATYRIFCTLFQHALPPGQWSFKFSIREQGYALPAVVPALANNVVLPKARAINQPLLPKLSSDGDLSVTTLTKLPAPPTQGEACWSADGKACFVLHANGTLLRVGVPDLVEQRRLDLGRNAGAMAMSAQGLVVTVPAINEVWLIDPDDLQVKKRFAVFAPTSIASSPRLNYAFVASPSGRQRVDPLPVGGPKGGPDPGDNRPSRTGLVILDLANGAPAGFHDLPSQAPAVSPDGKFLFAMDDDILTACQIKEDGRLVPQPSSGRLGFNNGSVRRIEVSPDSKYVCAAGATQDVQLPDHPIAGRCPAFVYPVDNLRKPVCGIGTGVPLRAVGFDPKTHRVFAHAFGKPVIVFDMEGRRLTDFSLPNTGPVEDPMQFLTHADGNKLLIRFPSKLCFAVFKAAGAPVVQGDPKFPAPSAVKNPESIAGKPTKRGAFTYRELQPLNPGAIDPCWDADGQAFFQLEADGTLTRVNAGDFLPKIQLAIGRPVSAMALSAKGLLVAFRDEPEIWVIDARTLVVQRRVVCTSPARFLASHPKLSVAVAAGAEAVLLDLTGRGAVRGVPVAPEPGQSFESPALTPDGTLLFLNQAGVGSSKVLRIRIDPDRLVVEDTKVTPVKASHVFCVTADGKHVAWFSPLVANKKQETEFYAVGDWKAPAFTLPEPARAIGAAQDGSLIVHTHQHSTFLFAQPAGPKVVRTSLQFQENVRSIATHPQQPGVFLTSTGTKVFHVER